MTRVSIYRFVLFPLLCILQCCRCLPIDFQYVTGEHCFTLNNLKFLLQIRAAKKSSLKFTEKKEKGE